MALESGDERCGSRVAVAQALGHGVGGEVRHAVSGCGLRWRSCGGRGWIPTGELTGSESIAASKVSSGAAEYEGRWIWRGGAIPSSCMASTNCIYQYCSSYILRP